MSIRTLAATTMVASLVLISPAAAFAQSNGDAASSGRNERATLNQERRNERARDAREAREARAAERDRGRSEDHRRDGDRPNGDARSGNRGRGDAPAGVGNSGTIKISTVEEIPDPSNEPHPGCGLRVDFYGFRPGTFDLTIATHAPTGNDQLFADEIVLTERARGNELNLTRVYDIAPVLPPSEDGRWHLRVEVQRRDFPGNGTKTKMLWLECSDETVGTEVEGDVITGDTRTTGGEVRVLGATLSAPSGAALGSNRAAMSNGQLAATGSTSAPGRPLWIALTLLAVGLALSLVNSPALRKSR